jgi:tRNA threonylcarbamoyladenosine biosynthesis protein TsaE|tara:strand:- start:472 stop:921 length:450 start_codon:yes stop_codon:yes gene_type:complete
MIIKSLDQLNQVTLKIVKKINKEDCILLFGEIGAGKTTLIRALINNLQNQNKQVETEVLSPTFNILYEYEINELKIMHYDLYRLKTEKDIQQLGIFNQSSKSIKIIEWAEIIKKIPYDRLEVYIYYEKEQDMRKIDFKGFGKWKEFNAI